MPTTISADVEALIDAAATARFYFHTEIERLKRPVDDALEQLSNDEGLEIAAEAAISLARSLMPFRPDQPACRGCCDRTSIWAKSPRDLLAIIDGKKATA